MKIGFGYDAHKFIEGRLLFIGGVEIPYIYGLDGYSDADVLLHALSDALLGAAGEGDIGIHFPDTDPKYKGISSLIILKEVYKIIEEKKLKISNIDVVIVADEPKLSPYFCNMKEQISKALDIEEDNINIKATKNEGLGGIGEGEGISAYAVVMLKTGGEEG